MKLVIPDHTKDEVFLIQFKGTAMLYYHLMYMNSSTENFTLNTIKEELVVLLK